MSEELPEVSLSVVLELEELSDFFFMSDRLSEDSDFFFLDIGAGVFFFFVSFFSDTLVKSSSSAVWILSDLNVNSSPSTANGTSFRNTEVRIHAMEMITYKTGAIARKSLYF